MTGKYKQYLKNSLICTTNSMKGGDFVNKKQRIQKFLDDMYENKSIIHISTTLCPSIDITVDDGAVYLAIQEILSKYVDGEL